VLLRLLLILKELLYNRASISIDKRREKENRRKDDAAAATTIIISTDKLSAPRNRIHYFFPSLLIEEDYHKNRKKTRIL
jgi:hypothetical protein